MLSTLTKQAAGWLTGEGAEADICLSSRARIARNITGFHFLSKVSPSQQREVERVAREAILEAHLADDLTYLAMDDLSQIERRVLVERHLISRELAQGERERGVAVGRRETLSIMVNEEDHLRLQALHAGLDVEGVWAEANAVDDALAERVPYAFTAAFGYLTACPTNVGTGLRVSVMLHLPGLVISRHIEKVFNAVSRLHLVVRGLYGEGTEAAGDFYQVSNQRTLGRSEEEIVRGLASVVPQVIEYERQVREAMLREGRTEIADQVWRAYGLLAHARSVSSAEALYLLSRVRLGVHLGLIPQVRVAALDRLLLLTQPAHIQQIAGRTLTAEERNAARAELIRSHLAQPAAAGEEV